MTRVTDTDSRLAVIARDAADALYGDEDATAALLNILKVATGETA